MACIVKTCSSLLVRKVNSCHSLGIPNSGAPNLPSKKLWHEFTCLKSFNVKKTNK